VMNWNPHSPGDWSEQLGMLSVPLFGSKRTSSYRGAHVLLLDGERASCTFSSVDAANDGTIADVLGWAWSSNVTHSILSEESTGTLSVRRWDDPRRVSTYPKPSRRAAEKIIETLRGAPQPDAATVVSHALTLFRGLRRNLEERRASAAFIVRAFNALALWATVAHSTATPLTLGEIFSGLKDYGWEFDTADAQDRALAFPAQDFLQAALAKMPGHPYMLDADLMLRHAGGAIYEEAHRELVRHCSSYQRRLFADDFLVTPDDDLRLDSKDVHYTPPPFARALVLEAARALQYTQSTIDILDPACGSGGFLIEAAREFAEKGVKQIRLRGVDLSPPACEMARFNLRYHIEDIAYRHDAQITADVLCRDSLGMEDWKAQVVLMNPPFTSWDEMEASDRRKVQSLLGPLSHGRPDISAAFFHKAWKSIEPGGVVATVLPSSFLSGKASEELRRAVTSNPEYSLCLLGRFKGFGYFTGATVEPGFVVVARNERKARPRIVLSSMRYADRALRMLRKTPAADVVEPRGSATVDIESGSWIPQDARVSDLLKRLRNTPRVRQLFDVKLGVRTGDNKSFMMDANALLELPKREHKYFRLAAGSDTIRNCTLWPSQYVFYPYDDYGVPTINSDDELKKAVPEYLRRKLLPRKQHLLRRAGIEKEKWWLLTRPRPTWQGAIEPRLVSAAFADIGKFALDTHGKYVVVQGNAWIWKGNADLKKSHWFSYLAILNSPAFMLLFSHYCRQVQGGQYEAYAKYSNHVPIPDLTIVPSAMIVRLAEMGRSMYEGWFPNIDDLDVAVAEVFGVSYKTLVAARPELDLASIPETFTRLARQCRRETAVLSNPRQIAAHPAYQQIIRLGTAAIPFIMEAMKIDGALWLQAMSAISGDKPNGLRRSDDIASAIEQWSVLARGRGWL
jgi:adenine-specific DNA-methyltransferase